MAFLCFSCDFDVVVGEGEHSIYLFGHLDRKSTFLEDIEGTVSLWEKPKDTVRWWQGTREG